MWHKATFRLNTGKEFTIMHNLVLTGHDSIENAFEYWSEQDETKPTFMEYLNRHGVLHAMTIEKYDSLKMQNEINDSSLMPFGKHQGKKMIDIPAFYLILIFEKGWIHHEGVKKYVVENLASLRLEIKKNRY
jgi:uncharacterized protein (DUF3820 family)